MSSLTGNYICKTNNWLLSLNDLGNGKLTCSLNFGLNTLTDAVANSVTLEGTGFYYDEKLFNIGFTVGSSIEDHSITVASGWSGYQVANEDPLQLKLEGVITCLAEGKVLVHTCIKDCLFEKIVNDVSVSIFLDTDFIVENSGTGGTCDSPIYVNEPNKCIYMVSDYEHEITGHGHAELNIQANPGDEIIWRASAIDFGSGRYSPYLYQFVATTGKDNIGDVQVDSTTISISSPKTNHNNAANCDLLLTQTDMGQISASVLQKHGVTYHICFMLVEPTGPDKNDFNVVGHYFWDPFINMGQ